MASQLAALRALAEQLAADVQALKKRTDDEWPQRLIELLDVFLQKLSQLIRGE